MTVGGSSRLVVSAHLDDAVLSCWTALTDPSAPRTAVLTVFAGEPPHGSPLSRWDRATGAVDAYARGLERQAEDRRALELCGVDAVHLGFAGGAYGPARPSWERILDAIGEVAAGFDEVWMPAGIGDHRDHLLVGRLAASAAGDKAQVVYADMPYTLSIDWRAMLACAEDREEGDRWLDGQRWVSSVAPRSRPEVVRLTSDQKGRKRQAIRCYASQSLAFDHWIDDEDRSGWEVRWRQDEPPRGEREPWWPLPALPMLPPAAPPALHPSGARRPDRSGPLITATVGTVPGDVDRPAKGERVDPSAVEVSGWAYSPGQPISRIEMWLDGQPLGRAWLGGARPDVARGLGRPDAILSGFELRRQGVDPPPDRAHPARLDVVAILRDGLCAPVCTVDVEVGPMPPSDDSLMSPSPNEPDRPPILPFHPARRRRRTIRTLWSARSLDNGGSQLRMVETVEHLVSTGRFEVTVLSPADGPLRARLEASGVPVRVAPGPQLDDAIAYETTIAEWAARFGATFDLVVGATITSFPAADMALRLGVPAVIRLGEAEPLRTVVRWTSGDLDPRVEERARRAFARASAVVAVCDEAVRVYRAAGFEARYVVVPTGVDTAAARRYAAKTDRDGFRRSLGVGPDERLVVCAGSIWPVKGQALLVWAMAAVAAATPRLTCALVGAPFAQNADAIASYADAAGISKRVRIVPFCNDLRPWWRSADVVACPSATEALPSVVLEGMAFGLPVLASRVGELPRLVQDGRNGWLCDPSDLTSLVSALERVVAAPDDTLVSMGSQSIRALRSYSRARNLAHWTSLLERATSGARTRPLRRRSPQGVW